MPATASAASSLDIRSLSRVMKALSDETRLRMVALLAHGELCVCHLEEALGLQQSTASRQLAVLRSAGVVETRRDGSWIYYRLAPQADALTRAVLRALTADFKKRQALGQDAERLQRTRGPGSCA